MKNSECTIYMMFKDRWLQKFRKEKEALFLTTSNGKVRPCSAEQLLSHILPPLAGMKGQHVAVKVEPDNKTKICAKKIKIECMQSEATPFSMK